jgi:hypothetical protein
MSQQVDTISATFVEKEIISARFNTVDILHYVEKHIVSGIITEIPTKLSAVRFQTSLPYVPGSVRFYLNGLKERKEDITEISTTVFEIVEAIASDDDIEVEYVELL